MRSIKSVFVALVAVLAFGAVAASGASAHQWKVNGVEASGQEVAFSGSYLDIRENSTLLEIDCRGVTGTGTVKAGGLGEAIEVDATGCEVVGLPECSIKTSGHPEGTIALSHITTELFELGGRKILVDEFKGKGKSEEFMKLETTGACPAELGGKPVLYGNVGASVRSLENGNVELLFDSEILARKKFLKLNGVKEATLEAGIEISLVGGGVLTAS